jgi:hypothetical protein
VIGHASEPSRSSQRFGGLVVWLDGGWGIDALLGRETRTHADLDLVIDRDQAVPRRGCADAATAEMAMVIMLPVLADRRLGTYYHEGRQPTNAGGHIVRMTDMKLQDLEGNWKPMGEFDVNELGRIRLNGATVTGQGPRGTDHLNLTREVSEALWTLVRQDFAQVKGAYTVQQVWNAIPDSRQRWDDELHYAWIPGKT